METPESSAPVRVPDRLNAVCHYVAYGPGAMPRVEVCLAPGSDGNDGTWAPGELRMHTQHEDGSRTFTAQYRLQGRLLIDNFPMERVR
jgi:hypothetical protein